METVKYIKAKDSDLDVLAIYSLTEEEIRYSQYYIDFSLASGGVDVCADRVVTLTPKNTEDFWKWYNFFLGHNRYEECTEEFFNTVKDKCVKAYKIYIECINNIKEII